jgi:hypothetical protein
MMTYPFKAYQVMQDTYIKFKYEHNCSTFLAVVTRSFLGFALVKTQLRGRPVNGMVLDINQEAGGLELVGSSLY